MFYKRNWKQGKTNFSTQKSTQLFQYFCLFKFFNNLHLFQTFYILRTVKIQLEHTWRVIRICDNERYWLEKAAVEIESKFNFENCNVIVGCHVGPVADVVGVDHLHYGAKLLGWLSEGNIVTASNNLMFWFIGKSHVWLFLQWLHLI